MYLKQLKRIPSGILQLLWDDGHKGQLSLQTLRDACPCAGCSGEKVLLKEYVPPLADRSTPGRYSLLGAEQVGSYALKFSWEDGHDQGIYTWEQIRSLCECESCRAVQAEERGRREP